MKSKKLFGYLLMLGGLCLIIYTCKMFYNYSLPHILYYYKDPNAILVLYLISGLISIISGIKILKQKLSIKKAYFLSIGFYLLSVIIAFLVMIY